MFTDVDLKRFWSLSAEVRNNPDYLKAALENFEAVGKLASPISFALEGALTDENIDLALEKGHIIITPNSAVSNCKRLILELFRDPSYVSRYSFLSDKLRSDSEVLMQALLGYDSASGKPSPISYALDGALTIENICLGLEKGNITFFPNSQLLNNRYFVMEAFKRGLYLSQYNNLPDSLKSDSEIIALLSSELDHMYKYNCSIIGVLPNGVTKEEEVKGRDGKVPNHTSAIGKVISDFCEKYEDDSYLCDIKSKLSGIALPAAAAKVCNDYGVLIILILNKVCMFFCPNDLSKEQYDVLQTFIGDNYECFSCELSHSGEVDFDLSKDDILSKLSEWIKPGHVRKN